MIKLTGVSMIMTSNLLFILILAEIRRVFPIPGDALWLLALGNALTGALLFSPEISGSPLLPNRLQLLTISMWSLCYVLIYIAYAIFPQLLPIHGILISELLAPAVAVYLSGDWRSSSSENTRIVVWMFGPLALFILLGIDILTPGGIAPEGGIALVVVTILFVGSQTSARLLSKHPNMFWAVSRLGLANGLGLFFACVCFKQAHYTPAAISFAMPFAIVAALVQVLFLRGLRITPPELAPLAIGSSVPLSLFIEMFFHSSLVTESQLLLAFAYCAVVYLSANQNKLYISKSFKS